MCQQEEIDKLKGLLAEALEWVTEKPWDDSSYLHQRISAELGKPPAYPDWDYSDPTLPETGDTT